MPMTPPRVPDDRNNQINAIEEWFLLDIGW
jgi:hypothetical protein